MYNFNYKNPTSFHFGAGKLNDVGVLAKQYGKKAILITYDMDHFNKLAEQVIKKLAEQNVECIIHNSVMGEPSTIDAVEGGLRASTEKCDLVIGLGGGSVLDMAKGVAHCAVHKDQITDYMYGKAVGEKALPIILIPTTAGTGSEGNHYAVFTNPETNDKKGLITPHLFAKDAILDPELLTSLPPQVIAGPGLDALYHAVEAYFSTDSTMMSEMYSLRAMTLIGEYLPKVYKNPSDITSWQQVQYASLLGGMAIGSADVGIPHALGHPIGGLYHKAHAETLAPTYKAYLNYMVNNAPEKCRQIAIALNKNIINLSLEESARVGADGVLEITKAVGMTTTLTTIGVQKSDLPWIINNAMTVMGSSIVSTPGNVTADILESILLESF